MKTCPECSCNISNRVDPSRALVADMWDAAALRLLVFADEHDRCPSCGTELESAATYILYDSRQTLEEQTVDIRVGSEVKPSEISQLVFISLGGRPASIRVNKNLKELLKQVVARVKPGLELLNDYAVASSKNQEIDWLVSHWRELDAPLFIVAQLLTSGRFPGTAALIASRGEIHSDLIGDDYFRTMARTQSLLLLVAFSIVADNTTEPLMPSLERLMHPGVLIPESIAGLEALADKSEHTLSSPKRYVLHAFHALACAVTSQTNKFSSIWAELYVAFELARRSPHFDESLSRLRIDPTVIDPALDFRGLWDALARRLSKGPTESSAKFDNLVEICVDCGRAHVLDHLLAHGMLLNIPHEMTPETLVAPLPGPSESPDRKIVLLCYRLMSALSNDGRIVDMERFFDLALARVGGDMETVAHLIAKFGRVCKEAEDPERFLQRVGESELPAEQKLSNLARLTLGVERSNALRLTGKQEQAKLVLDSLTHLSEDSDDERLLQQNRAILMRWTGQPDRSIAILEDLLPECEGINRLNILESLIASYTVLGRTEEAVKAATEGLALASGPWANRATALQLTILALGPDNQDLEEATKRLVAIGVPRDDDALLSAAGAWAALLSNDPSLARKVVAEVVTELLDAAWRAADRGNHSFAIAAFRNAAVIGDALDMESAEFLWKSELEFRQLTGAPDAVPLIGSARFEFMRGNEAEGRDLLLKVPAAMATELGQVEHAGVTIESTGALQRMLRKIARESLRKDFAPGTWRLIAELQRDGTGRAQMIHRATGSERQLTALTDGLDSNTLRVLAPKTGTLHVIEWFDIGIGYIGMRTTISSVGEVRLLRVVPPPGKVSLKDIALQLRSRLDGWRPSRHGDALDYEPWQSLSEWFIQQLGPVDESDHVIVIDNSETAGLPWHAIPHTGWTISYAPSWSSLLNLRHEHTTGRGPIGIITVPSREEHPSTVSVLENAVSELCGIAARVNREAHVCAMEAADRDSVSRVLSNVDIAILLCHGCVDPYTHEVALMLAYDGQLPSKHAIAASSSNERQHRWSWRDAATLCNSPRVLISAACSSGTSRVAGLDERLGLYGAMRLKGTRSVIAPLWDVIPSDACAILIDCVDSYIRSDVPLARSIHQASMRYGQAGAPRWRSAYFGLEGDWL